MEFLDNFLWFFGIFAVIYGILLIVIPKNIYAPIIEKQLIKKGNGNPTDEDIDKRLKLFRRLGVVCIAAGGVLFYLLLTGGVFAF